VLDVNVGTPGLDEVAAIKKVVELISSVVSVPLCLDSGNPEVLAAGLAAAPGKPLVNSVSGEEKRLTSVLPLVKERGAAVIGLTMDDNGIPRQPRSVWLWQKRSLSGLPKWVFHRGYYHRSVGTHGWIG